MRLKKLLYIGDSIIFDIGVNKAKNDDFVIFGLKLGLAENFQSKILFYANVWNP